MSTSMTIWLGSGVYHHISYRGSAHHPVIHSMLRSGFCFSRTVGAEWKENELKMREDMKEQAAEMLKKAGFKDVNTFDNRAAPGIGIHEMGTARMGRDKNTSILN